MARTINPTAVLAEVDRIMSRPFAWGACDCCSAACDVFAVLWGVDPMATVRGYTGARGAAQVFADASGLPALVERTAAQLRLRPGHAIGGLALTPASARRPSLLVCITPGMWAGKTEHGFAIVKSAGQGWHLA